MPGVVGLFAAGDLEVAPVWGSERMHESFARPALAREVVRFAGEPVTVMVAETRAEALDATERVVLEMDPLPAVVEPERPSRPTCRCCLPDAGTNVARQLPPLQPEGGDAIDGGTVLEEEPQRAGDPAAEILGGSCAPGQAAPSAGPRSPGL
jgi:carbon-monoxide dehydrogenase large subunit